MLLRLLLLLTNSSHYAPLGQEDEALSVGVQKTLLSRGPVSVRPGHPWTVDAAQLTRLRELIKRDTCVVERRVPAVGCSAALRPHASRRSNPSQ